MIIETKPPEANGDTTTSNGNGRHCKVNIEPRGPESEESAENAVDHSMLIDETKTLLTQKERPKRISFSKLSPTVTPEADITKSSFAIAPRETASTGWLKSYFVERQSVSDRNTLAKLWNLNLWILMDPEGS